MEALRPETRLRLGTALALVAIVLGFSFRHDVGPALADLEAAVRRSGPLGPLLFALAYGAWSTLCLPGPLMLAVAGTLFTTQALVGIAAVTAGESLAQALAFLAARGMAREKVRAVVGEQPWFLWLDEQTARHGPMRVATIRLMPFFPNSLANYAFGLTSVGFLPYLGASLLGSLPGTILYVGGSAGIIHILRNRSWEHDVGLAVALVLVGYGIVYLMGRRGRQIVARDD